jgi:hypothetical protein
LSSKPADIQSTAKSKYDLAVDLLLKTRTLFKRTSSRQIKNSEIPNELGVQVDTVTKWMALAKDGKLFFLTVGRSRITGDLTALKPLFNNLDSFHVLVVQLVCTVFCLASGLRQCCHNYFNVSEFARL